MSRKKITPEWRDMVIHPVGHIADRILSYRGDLTETEFAKKIGVKQATVWRLINIPEYIPKLITLQKIAKNLKIPVEALTHPDEQMSRLIILGDGMTAEDKIDLIKHYEMQKLYRESKKANNA